MVEGVDPDAAVLAAPPNTLKDLVKCGHYRFWGPLAGGVGTHNPGGSAFITAHRAALKNKAVYVNALAYLPLGGGRLHQERDRRLRTRSRSCRRPARRLRPPS